jgi:lysophospholipase L1-like esterase
MVSTFLAILSLQAPTAPAPEPRTDAVWQERHKALLQRSKEPLDVAFLGDSITHAWEWDGKDVWARDFSRWKAQGFGIGGDQTRHVLWRLANGELIPAKPKVVVLMIGTNNMASKEYTPDLTAKSIREIVDVILKGSPRTKILLLDIFPRAATPDDWSRRYVNDVNGYMDHQRWPKSVTRMSLARHFMDESQTVSREVMPDLLHLSPAAYDLWARAIREKIAELLGEPKESFPGGRWTSLFDGKTLQGWTPVAGTATYRVENGTIVGKTAEGSPNTFLRSAKEYKDFELTFEVKCDSRLNSGVQLRSRLNSGNWVSGPQVEIMLTPGHSGHFYGEGTDLGWLSREPSNPVPALNTHRVWRNGEWNSYRVVVQGPRFRSWINGLPVGDVVNEAITKTHPAGFIGLQVHGIGRGQGPFEVAWRNIKIRELKSSP